jgi:putative restriction endonuclease
MIRLMTYGHIAVVGDTYPDRIALAASGLHRNRQGGIQGGTDTGVGAESIVLSGGYEDDEDHGSFILYTGHGGRDGSTGMQIADQEFTRLNKTLLANVTSGQPVRVMRKVATGFRYDGLYSVDDAYDLLGKSGFRICRYELNGVASTTAGTAMTTPGGPAARAESTTSRIVRDTARSRRVKSLHHYVCQVCGVRLETKNGDYAEGAHIRPLGRPHDGPDDESNILCLCPNHHVQLDKGGLYITDDFQVHARDGAPMGPLTLVTGHVIDVAHVGHLRGQFGF